MPYRRFRFRRKRRNEGFTSFARGNTRVLTAPYKPRRRFRRRRRPGRLLWRMARKAYRFTRIHRPEMRYFDRGYVTVDPVPKANAWHSANLFVVGQGTTQLDRLGNTLFASMAKLLFWFKLNPPDEPPPEGWELHYRILVIQWTDNQETGILSNVDVFDNSAVASPADGDLTNILAPYRPLKHAMSGEQRDRKFRVLYDKTQQLYQFPGAVKNEEIFTVNIYPRSVIRFTGIGNSLAIVENPINLFIFSTSDATTGSQPNLTVSYRRREYYTARP